MGEDENTKTIALASEDLCGLAKQCSRSHQQHTDEHENMLVPVCRGRILPGPVVALELAWGVLPHFS